MPSIPPTVALVAAACLLKAAYGSVGFFALTTPTVRGAVYCALVAAYTAAGLILILLGRRDRRAIALGAFFLVMGSSFADPLLLQAAAAGSRLGPPVALVDQVQVSAFLPFFFWAFVQDFPRSVGPYRTRRWARVLTRVSWVTGVVLFAAHAVRPLLGATSPLAPLLAAVDRHTVDSLYWPLLFMLLLPILPYVARHARDASVEERRRASILLTGILVGIGPTVSMTLLEVVSPAVLAFHVGPVGRWVNFPFLFSIPFTTGYAIAVHRALDVRLIVRKALRYALARSSLMALIATPFLLAAALVYGRRHLTLGEALSGSEGLVLLATAATGLAALGARPRLLRGLDRHFFREQYDAHEILLSLVERARAATGPVDLARSVPAEVDRALHLESASLLLLDPVAQVLSTPTETARPLAAGSALARSLAERGEVEVEWPASAPWRTALSETDEEWLVDADARLMIAVRGSGGQLLGALVLGEKRSELPFSSEDRLLLRSVAHAVAMAVESRRLHARSLPDADDEALAPAAECARCGLVAAPDRKRCERCGDDLAVSVLPPLLVGKFAPLERIGRGGMGVVYRALDVTLTREVAVKTLPRTRPDGAARMRREARAMAAVSHPNLAAIHALESWRGTPMMIVEFLRGGTLADRLADGPLDVAAALELGGTLAEALACLHRAGVLHRDIKPSNIGFGGDGTAKLLDFGLAWILESSLRDGGAEAAAVGPELDPPPDGRLTRQGEIVGTLPYLSPEVVRGAPPTAALDLWALSMVLFETMAGAHPFDEPSIPALAARIGRGDVPDIRELRREIPAPVALLMRDLLSGDPARRPSSAREWGSRTGAVRRDLAVVAPLPVVA